MHNLKKYCARAALVLAVLMLSGCGNMYRINYSNIRADLQYSGSRSVAVGVLDERPYILSGENDPRYVGTMRGGYGNPFDLWTESDMQLADEMAATVANSLRDNGFRVLAVKAAVGKDVSKILPAIESAGAERLVVMVVKDWWSNYYPASWGPEKTELVMNVELKIMDNRVQVLGENRLNKTSIPPSGWPRDTIPGYYQQTMSELFNNQNILNALK